MRTNRALAGWALTIAVCGCNDRIRSPEEEAARQARAGTGSRPSSTTAGATPAPATSAAAPSSTTAASGRLAPTDKGVQTGLRLLRGEIAASEAVTAWTAEGLTPQEAQDVLARLPLTSAPGPGRHQATIVDAWQRTTDITLVVPQSPPPAAGYPLIVFLHGLGGNSGNVAGTAAHFPDALAVAPTALQPPANVTFEDDAPTPLATQFKHWWVYREGGFATRALDWMRERYPIDSQRIFLVGASMGGFGTWNVGLRLQDRFAGLVLAAAGISRKEFGVGRDALTRSLLANAAWVPVFFAHGDQDQVIPVDFSRACDQDLTALKIPHVYREVAGAGHDNDAFAGNAALMTELKAWVAARQRDPAPISFTHRAIGADHAGAWWVELVGAGTGASITASASGATVTVTTTDAQGARVWLDPRVVDVTRSVTVNLNGRQVFQGVPQASLEAVARSFARTRDPSLTYAWMVSP